MFETRLADRLEAITPNVYPNVAPTNYLTPCVVYQVLEKDAFNDLDGFTSESFVIVMLAISSTNFGEAKLLARDILNNLSDWQEDDLQAVSWLSETVSVDNSTATTLHRVMLFFRFYSAD